LFAGNYETLPDQRAETTNSYLCFMEQIQNADTDDQVLHCCDVIQSLRPHIHRQNILAYHKRMVEQDYHLIYIEDSGAPVAFAGYRFITHFFSGDIIYIDDLGTLPEHRGKGYGSALLQHIIDLARSKGLKGVRLDSGHHRHDAHRLYLNTGFQIVSHHFNLPLNELE
jgi:GNAT superfamily N-acetyltransferase